MDKTDCGNFIYLYSHSIFGTFDLLRVALLKTHALAHFLSRAARAPKPSVHSGFPWARYERMFPGEWEIESPQACAPLQKEPLKRVRQSSGWNKVELPGQQIHPHLPPLTDPYSCFRWRVVTLTNIHLWYRGGISCADPRTTHVPSLCCPWYRTLHLLPFVIPCPKELHFFFAVQAIVQKVPSPSHQTLACCHPMPGSRDTRSRLAVLAAREHQHPRKSPLPCQRFGNLSPASLAGWPERS